ncbi:MAG: response regulator transcription factor [Chitinophagaceae bacterium]|nr:response regulator transcription factor [Chitinophagaceae bacterium]
MIDKVIIAEDQEFANLSVQKTMDDLKVKQYDYAFYCDDALAKIQLAQKKGEPYDLLITDLSFEDDGTAQKINDGIELIRAVRSIQPGILILILSGQYRPVDIHNLFENHEVDAYVRKARHDVQELKAAMDALSKGQRYYPRSLAQLIKRSNTYEFTEFDITIIRLLSEGYQQNKIPDYLKEHNIKPSSLSSIEKRLNQIREELGFANNQQLMVFCSNAGLL